MMKDLDTAEALLERALVLDPTSAWAWERSGWLKTYLGQPKLAIRHFGNAIRLAPARCQNAHRFIGIGSAILKAVVTSKPSGGNARLYSSSPASAGSTGRWPFPTRVSASASRRSVRWGAAALRAGRGHKPSGQRDTVYGGLPGSPCRRSERPRSATLKVRIRRTAASRQRRHLRPELCRVSDTGPLDDLSSGAEGRCPKAFREGTRGGSADGLPSMGI